MIPLASSFDGLLGDIPEDYDTSARLGNLLEAEALAEVQDPTRRTLFRAI